MIFYNGQLLWILLLPACLLAWEVFRARKILRASTVSSGEKILTASVGARSVKLENGTAGSAPVVGSRRRIRCFFCLGFACAIVALARPQWGRIEEPVFEQSREILLAVDLSRSMLATDVTPSRLERCRLLAGDLLDKLNGEQVGLVVFAGTAFLQAPMSSDYEILREFLPVISPDYLPQAGTNYAAMLTAALDAFGNGTADRFLIVLSDGEADPENPWRSLAAQFKEKNIRAITLGIGTAAGAMIPASEGGLLKDERGAVVLSKLEPATLRELAELTNGTCADASAWLDLAGILHETVEQGRTGEFQETVRTRLAERFQWVLAPAVLFFLLSLWREFPVKIRPRAIKISAVKSAACLAGAILFFANDTAVFAQENILKNTENADENLEKMAPPASVDTSASAEKLSAIVARISSQKNIAANDTVAFAEATLNYAEPLRAQQKPVSAGIIDDALESIRRAEKKDPDAADWKTLRARLEALKKTPPPQNQTPDENSKSEKNENEGQQDRQDSQSGKSENSEQKNDTGKENSQNENGEKSSENQDSKSSENSQNDGKNPEQKNGTDDGKSDGEQNGTAPEKERETGGKQAFSDIQKSDDEKENQDGDSEQKNDTAPEENAAKNNTKKVGGIAAKNTPLDGNTDPKLLVPLQRLERVKEGDMPAKLFQRLQESEGGRQTEKGRTW